MNLEERLKSNPHYKTKNVHIETQDVQKAEVTNGDPKPRKRKRRKSVKKDIS